MTGLRLSRRLDRASFYASPGISAELRGVLSEIVGRRFSLVSTLGGRGAVHDPIVFVGPALPEGWTPDSLIWCHSTNAGIDRLLGRGNWDSDVLVTRTVGRMGRRMAEYVLTWMLAEYQQVEHFVQQQRAREWQQRSIRWIDGELALVFGTGHMGGAIGHLLQCCGLQVIGVSRTARHTVGFDAVVDGEGAIEYLGRSRWLISTLPLTRATRNYFDRDFFGACSGACFINVGRGATVQRDALLEALTAGRLRRAVLDVLPDEPPASDDGYWSLPNTVITPHIAGPTRDTDVVDDFRNCWDALRSGERPSLAVDLGLGY